MDIITTPRELMDRGVWIETARLVGLNEWAVNEGQMDGSEEIRISEDHARELGLLPQREGQ